MDEPLRLDQGPRRPASPRGSATGRENRGKKDRGAHLGKYGNRPRGPLQPSRDPLHDHDPLRRSGGKNGDPQASRRRDLADPGRSLPRRPSQGRGDRTGPDVCDRRGDAEPLRHAQPVREPRQRPGALRNDRPGDLGADRGEGHPLLRGVGTCGTITGVAKYLKERNPDVRIIAIEPEKGHRLSGLKNFEESKMPEILDRSLVDKTVRVPDEPAYRTTIRLAREESLLAGPTTGAIVWAALQEDLPPGTVSVCISPDNAFKYVSFLAEYVARDGVPEVSLTV